MKDLRKSGLRAEGQELPIRQFFLTSFMGNHREEFSSLSLDLFLNCGLTL